MTLTVDALDYSYGRPDLGVLAAHGIQLVCRDAEFLHFEIDLGGRAPG